MINLENSRRAVQIFRWGLPLWLLSLGLQLEHVPLAVLWGATGLALASPQKPKARVALALGLICLTLVMLGKVPSHFFFFGMPGRGPDNTWHMLSNLATELMRWCFDWKSWLPMLLPPMLFGYAASQMTEDKALARSLMRVAAAPLAGVLALLLAWVALLGVGMALRIPSGLIVALLGSWILAPIVLVALLVWPLRLSSRLRQLELQLPLSPPGPLPVGMLALGLLGVLVPRSTPGYAARPAIDQKKFEAKLLKVDWYRLDGRFALEVGKAEFTPDSGDYGIDTALSKEIAKHATDSKAGQMMLFCEHKGNLRMNAYGMRSTEPYLQYDHVLKQDFHSDREPTVRTDFLPGLAYTWMAKRPDPGACIAWEKNSKDPVELELWVTYAKPPSEEQLKIRCQAEVIKYREGKLRSVRLHAGTAGRTWKPLRSVLYSCADFPQKQWYVTPSRPIDWKLTTCPALAPSPLALKKHQFYASRPPAKTVVGKQFDAECKKQRELLLQALMQYRRDHGGAWPASAWAVVPEYVAEFPSCPLNQNWEYLYVIDPSKESCRLSCPSSHTQVATAGHGPYSDSAAGWGQFNTSQPTPTPELQECLKHPKGWLLSAGR